MHDRFAGQADWIAPNPPTNAVIDIYLKRKPDEVPTLTIFDPKGEEIRVLEGELQAGLQRITWNLRRAAPDRGAAAGRGGGRRGRRRAPAIQPGTYTVRLEVDGLYRYDVELSVVRVEN